MSRRADLFDLESEENFKWVLSLIRRLRPDLTAASRGDPSFLLGWLAVSGIGEYALLREHAYFNQYLNRLDENSGLTTLQLLIYLMRPDIRKLHSLPAGRAAYLRWFYEHGAREHGLESIVAGRSLAGKTEPASSGGKRAAESIQDRPFGVNLIGYAFGELGIGEHLRMMAMAFKLAGIPFTVLDFPPGPGVPQNDRSMSKYTGTDTPYAINIFCMTALETARYYLTHGKALFQGRYNIGSWHWELERWPDEWRDLTYLMDEIWVASRHVQGGLAACTDVPALVMPLPVHIGDAAPLTRASFGLPEDAYLFCFAFDFRSYIRRKNPQAVLEAFKLAFKPEEKHVGLVIKSHSHSGNVPEWEQIKAAARADGRIFIIEETLGKAETLALYQNCDCFLSLHRAEGYGMGIAEALLLGLDVIATGYSGNVDFCENVPQAHLVDYTLVPVGAGDYPYGTGQRWAEPDLNHAAELMRRCASGRNNPKKEAQFPFSLHAAGARYKARLGKIWHS